MKNPEQNFEINSLELETQLNAQDQKIIDLTEEGLLFMGYYEGDPIFKLRLRQESRYFTRKPKERSSQKISSDLPPWRTDKDNRHTFGRTVVAVLKVDENGETSAFTLSQTEQLKIKN
jgi:hypothetical protein